MKNQQALRNVRIQNFKAIQDTKTLALTPFTALIGNNGSGKSSLLEALETYRTAVVDGLDKAMAHWFGFEHVLNKAVRHNLLQKGLENPITFAWRGQTNTNVAQAKMVVNTEDNFNAMYIEQEEWKLGKRSKEEDKFGVQSALPTDLKDFIASWQFISLMPDRMTAPAAKHLATRGRLMLNRDGSNLAQYLSVIREQDLPTFNGIVETMRFVLSYAKDFQPVETQEIQRSMYVRMTEKEFHVPGWMLSTGTVRILAMLAVLRNPAPPPFVVIEEMENGLDPRTLHMLLDEIRDATQSGRTQVLMTTHSPYLLNLVPLETVILVERRNGGAPVFWRPADDGEVREWAKKFAPGELYTTGRLKRKDSK
jgi:predicted ATPase